LFSIEEEEQLGGGGCNFAEHPQHRTTTTTLSRASPSSSHRLCISLSLLLKVRVFLKSFPHKKKRYVFARIFFFSAAAAFAPRGVSGD